MSPFGSTTCKVALDPSWQSLNLPGREIALRAFTVELIEEIGKIEKIDISVYDKSWNDLIPGLQHGDYNGILSNMEPYIFHEKVYDFSDPYLSIGPALVVPIGTTVRSLEALKGKEIAVIKGSQGTFILEKYPDVLQRNYDSIPQALNDVVEGVVNGAIIDTLNAYAYCNNVYHGQLVIALSPLNQEGLRLITLHGKAPHLMKAFQRGLATLKKNGTYKSLTQKWNLQN
ncbi:MAG: transporter substrate-binding domain-containing protein [Rhabdochlamydiaceae bacterium]